MRTALLSFLVASLAAATATTFDGAAHPLPEVQLADADEVVLGEGAAPALNGCGIGVQLADGSWLPARSLAAGGKDAVLVDSPVGRLTLPLPALVGWGSPEPPAAAGNEDVVVVESGPLRGRVLGITGTTLRVQSALDAEPLSIELAQVRGLRLAVAVKPSPGLHLTALLDPTRPPLALLPTGAGLAVAPTVAVEGLGGLRLRVEGGRRVYLSDLKPAVVREDGAFGVVWPHSRDAGLHGGPLRLGGRRHAKGLVVHSAAELAWDLGKSYARFRAQVGISDEVAPEGDLVARLHGDGKELWRSRVRGGEAPRTLDLDVSGVGRLTLVVELGERYDIGDDLALADAQLIRR